MNQIGIIEGFFGPEWPQDERKSYAEFLRTHGGDFYLYAPKRDQKLRKAWREDWDGKYLDFLKELAHHFHRYEINFGVGFSPMGLGPVLSSEDEALLSKKLSQLNDVGVDLLGLFFDDMPTSINLAATQVTALNHVLSRFAGKIIFCPSYYTLDPILDKVFGTRPPNYLEEIAAGVPPEVSIAWTGPKVISPVIDEAHLLEVGELLKRRPFIWENLYANDGPKNCKFLKLRPFLGRDERTFRRAEGFGFNLMNQPELSKLLYLSSKYALEGQEPHEAFERAVSELCTPAFRDFLKVNREHLLETGLDNFRVEHIELLLKELEGMNDPGAREVSDWLQGKYNVGPECLTD